MQQFFKNDLYRVWSVLIFSCTQWLVTLLPRFGFGTDIGTRAKESYTPPTQPADYAFIIWGLIFPWCLAYGIYQFLPRNRAHRFFREIGWPTAAAFALNTLWALVAQFFSPILLTAPIMIFTFTALMITMSRMEYDYRSSTMSMADYWFAVPAVSLLAGWISIALFANWAPFIEYLQKWILNETIWSIIFLIGMAFIVTWMALIKRANVWYLIPALWGSMAIVFANTYAPTPNYPVAIVAAIISLWILMLFMIMHWNVEPDQKQKG